MAESKYTQNRTEDRLMIMDAAYRYCRAVDRADWEALRDVYHPDSHDNHGFYVGGLDGFIQALSERHRGIERSMHLLGNILVEFADEDNALAEVYSYAIQRYSSVGKEARNVIAGGVDMGEHPFDMIIAGRCLDHYRRREGEWKIFRRTVVFDNSMILPVPEDGARLNPAWAVSTRGPDDPLFEIRRSLGIA